MAVDPTPPQKKDTILTIGCVFVLSFYRGGIVQEKAFQHEKLMAGSTNERSILLYSDEDGVHRLRGLDKKFDSAQLQVFEEIHASESGLKNFIELSYFHFEYESTQITSPGTLPAPPGAPSGRGRKPETAATVNSRLKRDNEYRDKLKRYQEELQRAVVGNTPGGSRLLDPWLAIENKLASVGVLASIGHKLRRNLGRYVEINSFSWTPEIHMPQSSDRTTDDDYQSKCSDKIANYKEWVVKQEDAHPEGLFVPRGWKDNLRIRNQAADKDKFVPWLYMKRSQYKRDAMGVFAAREFPPWTLVGFISGKVLLKAAEKGTVFPDSDIDQVAQLVKSHSVRFASKAAHIHSIAAYQDPSFAAGSKNLALPRRGGLRLSYRAGPTCKYR